MGYCHEDDPKEIGLKYKSFYFLKGVKMFNKIVGKIIDKLLAKKMGLNTITYIKKLEIAPDSDKNYSIVYVEMGVKVKNDDLLNYVDKMK